MPPAGRGARPARRRAAAATPPSSGARIASRGRATSSVTRPPSSGRTAPPARRGRRNAPLTSAIAGSSISGPEQPRDEARVEVERVGVDVGDHVALVAAAPATSRRPCRRHGPQLGHHLRLLHHPGAVRPRDVGGAVGRRGVDHQQLVDEAAPLSGASASMMPADRAATSRQGSTTETVTSLRRARSPGRSPRGVEAAPRGPGVERAGRPPGRGGRGRRCARRSRTRTSRERTIGMPRSAQRAARAPGPRGPRAGAARRRGGRRAAVMPSDAPLKKGCSAPPGRPAAPRAVAQARGPAAQHLVVEPVRRPPRSARRRPGRPPATRSSWRRSQSGCGRESASVEAISPSRAPDRLEAPRRLVHPPAARRARRRARRRTRMRSRRPGWRRRGPARPVGGVVGAARRAPGSPRTPRPATPLLGGEGVDARADALLLVAGGHDHARPQRRGPGGGSRSRRRRSKRSRR